MSDNAKLTRKDLKGPDEFILAFNQAAGWLRLHRSQALAAAGAILLVVAIGFGVRSYSDWQRTKASEALWPKLNMAREVLQSSDPIDLGKLVAIEQFLTTFVNQHPATEAAVYARYYLGSIALSRHNADVSIAQFKDAIAVGKDRGFIGFLCRMGYANALESKGDFAMASSAYRDASGFAPPSLRHQAQLGEARTLTLQGRKADAIAIYRGIAAADPDPATKDFVGIKLARMQ